MTLNQLIDIALTDPDGKTMYDAYDRTARAAQNERGQVLDVRTNAVLDVLKYVLMFGGRPLTADERSILKGLRTTE